jgi:hypothetical protein
MTQRCGLSPQRRSRNAERGIEHAKANGECSYLGRKPTLNRNQFAKVQEMLGQRRIAAIAKETSLTRQPCTGSRTIPQAPEATLPSWGM